MGMYLETGWSLCWPTTFFSHFLHDDRFKWKWRWQWWGMSLSLASAHCCGLISVCASYYGKSWVLIPNSHITCFEMFLLWTPITILTWIAYLTLFLSGFWKISFSEPWWFSIYGDCGHLECDQVPVPQAQSVQHVQFNHCHQASHVSHCMDLHLLHYWVL